MQWKGKKWAASAASLPAGLGGPGTGREKVALAVDWA